MNKKTKKTENEIELEVEEVKKEKETIVWEKSSLFFQCREIRRGLIDHNLESYFKLFENIIYDFENFLLKETPLTKTQEELNKAFKFFQERIDRLYVPSEATFYSDDPIFHQMRKETEDKEFVSINFYLKDKKNEELLNYLIVDLLINEKKKVDDRFLKIEEFKKQLEMWGRINLKY